MIERLLAVAEKYNFFTVLFLSKHRMSTAFQLFHFVTLVQKLRKSFFGEIEFLAPTCSSGSALTLDTLFGKIRRRVRELCSSFMRKSAQLLNHNNT